MRQTINERYFRKESPEAVFTGQYIGRRMGGPALAHSIETDEGDIISFYIDEPPLAFCADTQSYVSVPSKFEGLKIGDRISVSRNGVAKTEAM